jgi:hypothetical protein
VNIALRATVTAMATVKMKSNNSIKNSSNNNNDNNKISNINDNNDVNYQLLQ